LKFRRHSTVTVWSFWLVDLAMVILAFLAVYRFRTTWFAFGAAGPPPMSDYLWILYLSLAVSSLSLYGFGFYRTRRAISRRRDTGRLLVTAAICVVAAAGAIFALKLPHVSRLLVGLFGVFLFLFLLFEKWLLLQITGYYHRQAKHFRNVVVIGSDRMAREVLELLREREEEGYRVLGVVIDQAEEARGSVGNYPVLGTLADMERITREQVVDEVIVSVSRARLEQMEDFFLMCEEQGVVTRIAANFFPHVIARLSVEGIAEVPFLTFSTVRHSENTILMKRVFDLAVSSVALVLLSPLFALIAVLIKLGSKGPVFFKQTRVGLNGRLFTFYKFRSMVPDAEQRKEELAHLNGMSGPVFKVKNDPRITWIGKHLRRASMDELPQLWNVFVGDMSIVGPRPPVPKEVKLYERWQRRRLSVKPGLTCLWQIRGRNLITDFDEWVRLDLEYIDHWSFSLDLKIILMTIPVVLTGKGAT
jgi:exopolysaccharide biosynthesis polyprenyl glycosylphosphotransferase